MTATVLPVPRWSGPNLGWHSRRYPRTNGVPHALKLLRYPPNGNVDEWVDFGPDGDPTTRKQP